MRLILCLSKSNSWDVEGLLGSCLTLSNQAKSTALEQEVLINGMRSRAPNQQKLDNQIYGGDKYDKK